MTVERKIMAAIVRADLIICTVLPILLGLVIFGLAAFLILEYAYYKTAKRRNQDEKEKLPGRNL